MLSDSLERLSKQFRVTNDKYHFIPQELMDYLSEMLDKTSSPYCAEAGGLIEYILRSTAIALKINQTVIAENERLANEKIIRTGMLMHLGLVNSGQRTMSSNHQVIVWCIKYGIKLEEDEISVILEPHSRMTMLGTVLNMGAALAAYEQNTIITRLSKSTANAGE